MAKIKVSMTLDGNVYKDFKKYCNDNGMKVSSKVELMMRDSVKNISLRKFLDDKRE